MTTKLAKVEADLEALELSLVATLGSIHAKYKEEFRVLKENAATSLEVAMENLVEANDKVTELEGTINQMTIDEEERIAGIKKDHTNEVEKLDSDIEEYIEKAEKRDDEIDKLTDEGLARDNIWQKIVLACGIDDHQVGRYTTEMEIIDLVKERCTYV